MNALDSNPAIIAPAAPQRPFIFATVLTLVFLAASVVRILHHVPWRDEVRAWQLVRSVSTVAELREATRYDGHPALWSATLYPLSKLTDDFRAVQITHALIAGAAVFVLSCFAPFKRWQIVLLCLGYFVLFEYSIIARNYAWGMLFFFAALAALCRRSDRKLLFALCCAGAIQSNPFCTLLVAALGFTALIDNLTRWRLERHRSAAMEFAWLLIPIASAAFALWAMLPGPSERYTSPYDGTAPLRRLSIVFAGVGRALVPIPAGIDAWWNSALFSIDVQTARQNPALDYTVSAIAAAGVLVLIWLIRHRRIALLFLVTGMTLIVAFSFAQFAGAMRHNGHVVLALIGAWWLAQAEVLRSCVVATKTDRRRDAILVCLFSVQAIAGIVASFRDLTQPFTAAPAAGAWVKQHSNGLRLIGNPDYAAVPVAAAAGVPFYSPDSFDFVTFNTQGPRSPERPTGEDEPSLLAAIMTRLHEHEMLLIRSGLITPRPGESFAFDLTEPDGSPGTRQLVMTSVAEFPDSAIADEQYTIILVRLTAADPPATKPADKR